MIRSYKQNEAAAIISTHKQKFRSQKRNNYQNASCYQLYVMSFRIRAKFFWLCAEFVTRSLSRDIVFLTTRVVLWGSYNMNTVQGYDLLHNVLGGVSDEAVSRFYCYYPGGKRMTCPLFIESHRASAVSGWQPADDIVYLHKESRNYLLALWNMPNPWAHRVRFRRCGAKRV